MQESRGSSMVEKFKYGAPTWSKKKKARSCSEKETPDGIKNLEQKDSNFYTNYIPNISSRVTSTTTTQSVIELNKTSGKKSRYLPVL